MCAGGLTLRANARQHKTFAADRSSSTVEALPLVAWTAVLTALWAGGLPLAAALFPRFPDRGAALALPLALAVVTLVAYWVGHLWFGPLTVVAAVLVLALAAALALYRGAVPRPRRLGGPAAVFAVGFTFVLAIRAANPAVVPAGGEKFLDFGLLNAVLRADRLPPEDIWFAGERLRYYYGGYLTASIVARLSGTAPAAAYNLAVATFYGLLVAAAYGLAGALAAARDAPRRLGGVAGAFLVGLAGNLATPARVAVGLLPPELTERYAWLVLGGVRLPYEEAVTAATGWQDYDYWFARYVIADTPNVFPYWTFLNGDLRPHMTSGAALLAVAALGFAYYRTPWESVRRRRLLLFGAVPLLAGYLTLVNTWGLPAAVGLVFLASLFAPADPASLLPGRLAASLASDGGHEDAVGAVVRRELRRGATALGVALVSGALAALVAAPLLARTPENGGLALLPPRSGMGGLVLVHGAFLGVFALYLLRRLWPDSGVARRRVGAGLAGIAGLLLAGVVLDLAAVALFGPLLVAAWWTARREGGYETVLIIAGLGIVLAVEFLYAVVWPYDPNAPRWNTVYKAYTQTWELWGVAGGAAVAWLAGSALPRLRALARGPSLDRLRAARWDLASVVLVVVLLGLTGTFAAATVPQEVERYTEDGASAASLDATAYVSTYHPGEDTAIAWLDDREGTPTVVAAPGTSPYQWYNAPSSLTGLPTVAGWEHAAGYHGRAAYRERVDDVEAIYAGNWSAAADRLAAHDVRYVYVGPAERERYGEVSFAGLAGVSVAHQSGEATVYGVEQSALAVRPEYEGRQRATTVGGALRERYCSEPVDERPAWLPDGLCSEG